MKTWLMKRNCALSPKELFRFYWALVAVSLIIGIGFSLLGYSIILIFTCIELTALTAGFLIYSRHALDFEQIEIEGERLRIKKSIACKETVYEFNTRWARIDQTLPNAKSFEIFQSDLRIPLGQFLLKEQRSRLIVELKAYLR